MKQSEVTFDIQKRLRGEVEGPWLDMATGYVKQEPAQAMVKRLESERPRLRFRIVRVERTEIG